MRSGLPTETPLKVAPDRAETRAMRLRKGRKDADTAEQPKSTIGDVGLGKYGPDDTKERPVSRFERPRVTKRRSDAQHKA